jgi:hypothetical protein
VTENLVCEDTDLLKAAIRSDMTSLQVMVASARSVGWGSNEAVTMWLPPRYEIVVNWTHGISSTY